MLNIPEYIVHLWPSFALSISFYNVTFSNSDLQRRLQEMGGGGEDGDATKCESAQGQHGYLEPQPSVMFAEGTVGLLAGGAEKTPVKSFHLVGS